MPKVTDRSDAAIAQAAVHDHAEFEELYWRYAAKIYQFVRYRTNNNTDAQDLVSDIFTKVLSKLDTYDPQQSFSTWLFTIARHSVIDFWRTQRATIDLDIIGEVVAAVESPAHKIDTDLAIEQVMSKLSAEETILVTLRFVDDLSYKEIAKITGKSEVALRSTFHRLKQVFNQPEL